MDSRAHLEMTDEEPVATKAIELRETDSRHWNVVLDGREIGTLELTYPGRSRRNFYQARAHDRCDLGTWADRDEAAATIVDDWEARCPRSPSNPRERWRWQFAKDGEEPRYVRRTGVPSI
jgi:hypothetical protein